MLRRGDMQNRYVLEKKYIQTGHGPVLIPIQAFPTSETVRFCIESVSRDTADTAVLRVHCDADGKMQLFPMKKESDKNGREFSVAVSLRELCSPEEDGLFYYCYDLYFPDGCVSFGGEEAERLLRCDENHKRQLLVYREDFQVPSFLRGGIMYHIFVDRFRNSHLKDDSAWHRRFWQQIRNRTGENANSLFFGGDLYGVVQKLDYLASLGVTCLYLSPIFEAASNHKYDTGDYEHVDSGFGGDAALLCLLRACRKRKIHVILDGVFNHTGDNSRYFNRYGRYPEKGAWQSQDSPYYPWYTFRKYPQEYESWWGIRTLPKVNTMDPGWREYILGENGIVARWMHLGIDGWRLDVADELSDSFLNSFRERVRAVNSSAVIYGEVWEDASNKIAYAHRRQYLRGGQLDSVMNYPLREAVIAYIRQGDAAALQRCVQTVYGHYPKPSSDILMNVLGTHDTVRIITALGSDSSDGKAERLTEEQRARGIRLLQLAYPLLAMMPGIPCVFYGDEAGVDGYGDPFCRSPYPWGEENGELIAFYRMFHAFRKQFPVLRDGYVKLIQCTPTYAAVLRYNGEDSGLLLLLNRTEHTVRLTWSAPIRHCIQKNSVSQVVLAPCNTEYYTVDHPEISITSCEIE